MSENQTRHRFRPMRVLLYAVALCGVVVLAFAIGLHAGSERTAVFRFVQRWKVAVENSFSAYAGTQPKPIHKSAQGGRDVVYRDAASIARAQSENKPPQNYLDWAGFYRMASSKKELEGLTPLNPWLPPVIAARLQPWARAKLETTDGVAEDTGQICEPTGLFRVSGFSGAFLWLPGPEKVVIANWAIETAGVQRVYLNRIHRRNLLPSWNGDSIGYWDGDTLVVDTVGFNDKSWLHSTMEPHSEEAHLVQRIRQVKEGAFLEVHYTVEDRRALTSAYTYTRYYKKAGETRPESICNDDLQIWREFRNTAIDRQLARAREVDQE